MTNDGNMLLQLTLLNKPDSAAQLRDHIEARPETTPRLLQKARAHWTVGTREVPDTREALDDIMSYGQETTPRPPSPGRAPTKGLGAELC